MEKTINLNIPTEKSTINIWKILEQFWENHGGRIRKASIHALAIVFLASSLVACNPKKENWEEISTPTENLDEKEKNINSVEAQKIFNEKIRFEKEVLSGSMNISDAQAEEYFENYWFELLHKLRNLEILNDKQAEFILKIYMEKDKGPLSLGILSMTDQQAKLFSRYPKGIEFRKLINATDVQIEYLSKNKWRLTINFDEVPTYKQIESLARHEGTLEIILNNPISDEQTESIIKHKGRLIIHLGGSFSDKQAELFSKHKWELELIWIVDFNDNKAKFLSKYKGDLGLWFDQGTNYDECQTLNDQQIEFFSKHQGKLTISWITDLTEEQKEILLEHEETVICNGVYYRR